MFGALGTVCREIQLVDGFYEVQGSFRIKAWYYEQLMSSGRPAPFLQAQEVLQTATTVTADRMPGFYRYANNVHAMVYNSTTREIWHLQPIGKP